LTFSGGTAAVGNKWLPRFFTRHAEVHSKTGKGMDIQRIDNTHPEILRLCGLLTFDAF
jgi:hypothetical protein